MSEEEAITAAFTLGKLLGERRFRERMKATGRAEGEATVPVTYDMTVEMMLLRAQHYLPGAVVVAVVDESAPHGFRLLRVTEMSEW